MICLPVLLHHLFLQTTSPIDDWNSRAQFIDGDTEQENITTGFTMTSMELQQEIKSGTVQC